MAVDSERVDKILAEVAFLDVGFQLEELNYFLSCVVAATVREGECESGQQEESGESEHLFGLPGERRMEECCVEKTAETKVKNVYWSLDTLVPQSSDGSCSLCAQVGQRLPSAYFDAK